MTPCPELGALEGSPLPPELRDHVAACTSCKLVVEVFDAAAGRLDVDDCVRFDALLAARADGTLGSAGHNLLERHLASCPQCREVAETLSPTQDADGDHATLPQVEPGSYALGLEIARGGMGRILAARDLRVGRPIAIKELLGRSPQLAARFEREARVTARLQHPGIVPIYEIGKWPDGTPFYSMRMVDGRTLADAIESAKTLAARLSLLPAVIAATEAVAFAHAKRVIHRDLTPSNVLVGAYGETVVIDWGLAKDLADDSDPEEEADPPENSSDKLTGAGAVIGTAAYMPPEQAHAVPVDERADVYALGAILYHVLAGAAPYRAKTARELLRAVKTAPPPPIEEVAPGTPRDLVSIITKAMARDPDARYPSARELAEELKRFQTGRLVEAHAYSRFELIRRFLRRHRAAVTVSALALVVLLSVGAIAVANILRSRADARATVRELILEKGRIELLGGNTQRALAYLYEAYQHGDHSPSLQFLLGSSLRNLSTSERTLDCGGNARTVAFDRGGKYVAAACTDVAKVWRLADGKELARLDSPQHDDGFYGVRFWSDPQGGALLLATWGGSGIARIWNPETGELRATLDHGSVAKQQARAAATGQPPVAPVKGIEITRATFSPDGKILATTGYDGLALIWDIASETAVRTIVGSTSGYRNLYGMLSPDGTQLYTMTLGGVGRGWNVATGEPFGARDHGSLTIGADVSSDGKRAVSCGTDRHVRVWNLATGAAVYPFAGHTDTVWKCVFSPDSKLVLSGGHDGRANVWDLANGKLVTAVQHGDIIVNADFSPDARRFATTGVGGRVKLWDTRTGELLASLDVVRGKDARFAPDNRRLVAARGDGRIQIWRFDAQPAPYLPPGHATIAATSQDGTRVVLDLQNLEHSLEVRDISPRDVTETARIPHAPMTPPFSLATGAPRLAGTYGTTVTVIDTTNGATIHALVVDRPPREVQLSANGERLAVTFEEAPPQIWDVASGRLLLTLAGAQDTRLAADGRRAIAWTPGARPVVWDVDGNVVGVSLATTGRYQTIGFARAGSRVALLEDPTVDPDDRTVIAAPMVSLWSTETGALIARRPDLSTVSAFDPTGTWLTTIDADHAVTVWSADDGHVQSAFFGEPSQQARVNPQGTFVAAVAEHGTVVLLMSATDGRILARWPLDHDAPTITEDEFKAPPATLTWSRDGGSVIGYALAIGVWHVTNDYTAKEIAQQVKRNVQWRVENGQLVWIRNGKLHGSVSRDGTPQPNIKVLVEIRTPATGGAAPMSWQRSKNIVSTRHITTNALGEFFLEHLLPGEYTLTVENRKVTAYVSAEDDPVEIELP